MHFVALLNVWNNIINTMIRDLPDYWKAIICLCAFALGCYCFAKSISVKDTPLFFKVGMFLTSLIFFGILILYIIYW